MKLSAAVMAHPDRAEQVEDLLGRLDRPVPVHWDDEGRASGDGDRVWRQARATWRMVETGADWHLLLQDDALPCPDLLAGLERALEHVPRDAGVSLYLGQGRRVPMRWARMAAEADRAGAAWVRTEKLMWGVAIALPAHLISSMIAWCDRRAGVPDDMRVSGWLARNGLETWYTWPSLVDHRSVPSLTKHRATDRVAQRHLDGSAIGVDWSRPATVDPMLTRRKGPRSRPRGYDR